MSIIVARRGFNRNTKKEILYGPPSLGGADFRDLYVEQGIAQVATFMRHWRMDSKTGKLARIVLAWQQLSTGVSFSILFDPKTELPHLESVWVKSTRKFLARIQGSLRLDTTSIPPLQRENDQYIMDILLESELYDEKEICQLNYCRLYLQVVTLSERPTRPR